MFVDSFYDVLVNGNRIFLSQDVYPLAFEIFLIVRNNQGTNVTHHFWRFEFFTINRTVWIAFYLLGQGTHLENIVVHEGIVSLFENALFRPDSKRRVFVECSAKLFVPTLKRCFFQ